MKIGIYGDRTPPLGKLERDVLEQLWTHGSQSARDVLDALSARRPITLSTIQATLERLTRKRLLSRTKLGRSYIYRAAVSRDSLVKRMVSDLQQALIAPSHTAGIAGLLELDPNVDAETLDRLERWIEGRRKQLKDAP